MARQKFHPDQKISAIGSFLAYAANMSLDEDLSETDVAKRGEDARYALDSVIKQARRFCFEERKP